MTTLKNISQNVLVIIHGEIVIMQILVPQMDLRMLLFFTDIIVWKCFSFFLLFRWTYSSSGGSSYSGELAYYHAGGYYQDLSNDPNRTKEIVKSLKKDIWIRRGTRVVFADFTVYNANLDLFAVCK